MPPAKSITLHLFFTHIPLKSVTVWMIALWQRQNTLKSTNLSADALFIYDWLPVRNNGNPLTKKINKRCWFSVFRFSVTVDADFNPNVLVSLPTIVSDKRKHSNLVEFGPVAVVDRLHHKLPNIWAQ